MEPCNHPHLVLAENLTSNGQPVYECQKCHDLFMLTLGPFVPSEIQFGTGNL